jgi:hypothetical protein
VPTRIFSRDQHRELERVVQVERRQFLRRRLGDDQVAALEGPPED